MAYEPCKPMRFGCHILGKISLAVTSCRFQGQTIRLKKDNKLLDIQFGRSERRLITDFLN